MNWARVRSELYDEAGGKCAICGRALRREEAEVDHIFPRRYGGSDRRENLQLVCQRCNRIKADRTYAFSFETAFREYLLKTLRSDSRFVNVTAEKPVKAQDGSVLLPDLCFTAESCGQTVLYYVETKTFSAVTQTAVASAVRQLEHFQRALPKARFILATPTALAEEHRRRICDAGFTLWDRDTLCAGIPDAAMPSDTADDIYSALIGKLKSCPPGRPHWPAYQKLVGEILCALFCPPIDEISEQNADADQRNRRDYVIPNYAFTGYWQYLREEYKASFLVVDAKNSSKKIQKGDILQVANYLKEKGTGLFAIIFSRCGLSNAADAHLKDMWKDQNKMIVVLDDSDVEQMLLMRQSGDDPCRILIRKIEDFRLRY